VLGPLRRRAIATQEAGKAIAEALELQMDLSALYPFYSLDPRAVWKGQFALLLMVSAAAAVTVIPVKAESRALRALKVCGVAGIIVIVILQCAVLIRYLLYPSYINHVEANTAAVSWLASHMGRPSIR
jgi:hypothetical protein